MFGLFDKKTHTVSETAFSKFIREASSGDKKRVYDRVLKGATERQIRVIEEVSRATDNQHAGAEDKKSN
jgi:hypothetical protein